MKVKFGLSNVYVAKYTISSNGAYTYSTPISIPGAVNIALSPSGEDTDFFADNIKYFSTSSNQGYEGDLEIALLTDEVREEIFGETKDKNGALIESSDDIVSGFALGFQIEGDEKGRKFWYYNCKASRSKNESKTNESTKTPNTDSITIKAMPRENDKKVRVFLTETTANKEAYDSFFESVYEEVQEA